MFKLVRPKQDTTIYGYAPDVNAGIDEVLELNTRKFLNVADESFSTPQPSRILMEFPELDESFMETVEDGPNAFAQFGFETVDRDDTRQALSGDVGLGPPNAFAFFGEQVAPKRDPEPEPQPDPEPEPYDSTAWLRMWFANGMGMPKRYEIQAFPLEAAWREGRGRAENNPRTIEPATWKDRLFNEPWQTEGGDFSSTPVSKEVFDGDDPDVELKMNSVLASSPENGIILKRKDEDFGRRTELKFFGNDTRTIYVPHLLVGVDDYEFSTEGSEPIEEENFTAYVSKLQNEYSGGPTRFEVTVEEKFEQRQFLGIRPTERTESIENARYLPRRSLRYQIKDVRTGTIFYPFDKRYSAVSFNGRTHYFDVNLDNLLPRREYKILLKYVDPETENEQIFQHEQTFKIE